MPIPATARRWSGSGDLRGESRRQWRQDAIDVGVIAAVLLLVALIAVL